MQLLLVGTFIYVQNKQTQDDMFQRDSLPLTIFLKKQFVQVTVSLDNIVMKDKSESDSDSEFDFDLPPPAASNSSTVKPVQQDSTVQPVQQDATVKPQTGLLIKTFEPEM